MFYSDYDNYLDEQNARFEEQVEFYVDGFNRGDTVFNPDVTKFWAELDWDGGDPIIDLYDDTVRLAAFDNVDAFREWVSVRESEAVN